jgi:hypothetical protein
MYGERGKADGKTSLAKMDVCERGTFSRIFYRSTSTYSRSETSKPRLVRCRLRRLNSSRNSFAERSISTRRSGIGPLILANVAAVLSKPLASKTSATTCGFAGVVLSDVELYREQEFIGCDEPLTPEIVA